ncbi:hypothetical protein RB595_004288 [Gaeumannomyces hyphopodioides]
MRSSLGETLKASMRFSDFTFISHDREFPAHRLVVMTQSPVLEKLIQSGELAEVGGKCMIQVNSVFSSSTVGHLVEYLYTESYSCPLAKTRENETTTPEPIHSATSLLELTDGDTGKPETSSDADTTVNGPISLGDKEMDPVIDSTLVPPGGSVDSSHQKDQDLVIQEALVQHLHILGLANTYQVQTLADIAHGYIANILSHATSAGPALRLIEEMKTTDNFDGQVWDLLYTCIMSHIQRPFGHRLLTEAFTLCDKIRTDVLRQKSINEMLRSNLTVAQAQLRASKDWLTVREMNAMLDAAPGLRMLEEVRSAQERLAGITQCRNMTCCATYAGFKGRVQVDHDLSVTVRCLACFCKH